MKKSMLALVLATATTFAFAEDSTFTLWFNAIPKATTTTGTWAVTDPGEVYDVGESPNQSVVVDTEYDAGATFTAKTTPDTSSKSEKISITATFSAAVPVAELDTVTGGNKVGVTIANDEDVNYWYFVKGSDGTWVKGAEVTETLPQSYDITIAIANDGTATYTVGGVNADTTGKTASKVNVVNVCGYGSFTQLKGETEKWGDIDVVIQKTVTTDYGNVTIDKVYKKGDTSTTYTVTDQNKCSVPWDTDIVIVYKAASGATFVVRNGSFELHVVQGANLPEEDVKDGVTRKFNGGTGAQATPFLIASYENLEELRVDVADGTDYANTYFQQTASVDFDSKDAWAGIGVYVKDSVSTCKGFAGIYDGNNQTISNLKFVNQKYSGFFRFVNGGTIKNLIIDGAEFEDPSAETEFGGAVVVGALREGTVSCVKVTGSLGTESNPLKHNASGVIGRFASGLVENCTNAALIVSAETKASGIVNITQVDKNDTVSLGRTISGCVNSGNVKQKDWDTTEDKTNGGVAGIIAYVAGDTTIANCSNSGEITSAVTGSKLGQIVGCLKSGTLTVSGCVGTDDTLAIGSGTCSGLNFATVENDIATLIADNAVVKGGTTYLVTALNAAPTVALAARNDKVTFDLSLVGDAFDDTNLTGAELTGYEFSKVDVNDVLTCAYVVADGYIELVFDVELASGAQTQSLALGSALPKPKNVDEEKAFEGWKIGESTEAVYALPTSSELVKRTVDAAASFVDAAPYTPPGQGSDTPIKVVKDSDWVKNNVGTDASTEQIQAAMASTDKKGKTGWQNYVLGLNTDQSLMIDSAAPYAGKLALVLNVNLPKVESGATVKYKLGSGDAADAVVIDPATLANGHHKVYAVVNGTNVETEREVGFMKVTAKTGTTIVAVPWESFTETAIEPTKLIDPSNRAADDELQIYGATTDTYDTYKIVNGEWSFVKSITPSGEVNERSVSSVARGNAVILKTAAAEPAPVLLLGSYNAATPDPVALVQPAEEGKVAWSIIANPDWENALNLNTHAAFKGDDADNGNSILIPNNGAAPTRYTKDSNGWHYNEQIVNGRFVRQERKTDAIPAGTGFYFLNKSGKENVDWAKKDAE